jgi:predicted RNA polymerase sigma factor
LEQLDPKFRPAKGGEQNRAVALAEVEGPDAALAAIESLASDKRMLGYQPYWAARGHLLARVDRR